MSDRSQDTEADAASPAIPTFKRKKRPAQSRAPESAPLAASREVGTDDADHEDSTSETLDELLALRRLKRSTAGLELDRLNSGERRKRAKVAAGAEQSASDGTILREDGTIEGTHGGLSQPGGGHGGGGARGDRLRDDSEGQDARQRKIIKTDNFTGQTNTVDVDKHMLAYIDAELAKRRDPSLASGSTDTVAKKALDPRDELYAVADKYKFADIEAAEQGKKERDEDEGNVTLSASMLMGIPEVDLGIDTKLANIEATEKAKRALSDAKAAARAARANQDEADDMAADRFFRHRRPLESDTDALERARAAANAAADPSLVDPDQAQRKAKPRSGGGGGGGGGRRELATDDMAMSRFKKRQQGMFGGGGGGKR